MPGKIIARICFLSFFLYLCLSVPSRSQEICKVLMQGIDSAYAGSCRKDLAHGVGEAWGKDHYYGEFRKGLPHGEGVYEYYDGSVYKGDYLKGLRHGNGEYKTFINGRDSILAGIWENDRYLGPEPSGPDYKVVRKRNVERIRVYRESDGNRVLFKFNMSASASTGGFDMSLTGSNGNEFDYSGFKGFENIDFPFTGTVRYKKWNKLKTIMYDVDFEIEINRPGNWVVELY